MIITVRNSGPIDNASIDISKNLIVFSGKNNTGKTYLSYIIYEILKTTDYYIFDDYKNQECNIDKLLSNLSIAAANQIKEFLSFKPQILISLSPNEYKILNKVSNCSDFYETINEIFTTKSYFFPAERAAIHSFYKDLVEQRAKKAELLYKKKRIYLPIYPTAVRDYIFFVNDFSKFKDYKSDFSDIADNLTKILGGKITIGNFDELTFEIAQNGNKILEMPATSSTVKSLAGLEFYFRHLATKGDIIFIDEPENNLHPDNQRLLTRILIKAVNKGIKIILSTHSDYIIREINNMIMLSDNKQNTQNLRKSLGYNENEIIKPEQVAAYLFTHEKIQNISVDKTGFEVETIDNEINSQNNIAQQIYFNLFD